jgi:glucokinase
LPPIQRTFSRSERERVPEIARLRSRLSVSSEKVAGDALAHAATLLDALIVIGGGISAAWPLFLPALVEEMNAAYDGDDGRPLRRLTQVVFNLEDPAAREQFVRGETRTLAVPGSARRVIYDPLRRLGVGLSRLGASEAVAIGAYAFALRKLAPATNGAAATSNGSP